MARINLLPWRAEQKKQKQNDFFAAGLAALFMTVLIQIAIHMHYEDAKAYQESRNQFLKSEIALVEKKIQEIKAIEEKKRQLLTKIDVIQKLQGSRPLIVRLFDELAKTTPDGVYLTNFVQADDRLTFIGKAESNARVSAFMRSIEASKWLHTPGLQIIQSKDKTKVEQLNDFTLIAKLGPKPAQPNGNK